CSTRNWYATVMARSGGGSWNGNVMSAFSPNRRRILSLWLPHLPIDRIQRQRAQNAVSQVELVASQCEVSTLGRLPLPLAGEGWGVGGAASPTARAERTPTRIASFDAIRPPPQAGEAKGDFPNVVVAKEHNALLLYAIDGTAARSGLSIGLP